MAVRAMDGYTVRLERQPAAPRAERLWFVNLGAYRPDSLAELAHVGLVVATSAAVAKAAAGRRWLRGAMQQHSDNLYTEDDCLALEQLELRGGALWHIQLVSHPQGLSQPQVPDWFGYGPI